MNAKTNRQEEGDPRLKVGGLRATKDGERALHVFVAFPDEAMAFTGHGTRRSTEPWELSIVEY